MIGIPADTEETEAITEPPLLLPVNGISKPPTHDSEAVVISPRAEDEPLSVNERSSICLPLKKRRIPPLEENNLQATAAVDAAVKPEESANESVRDPCKDCKKKKYRMIDALLLESERFMQYPSRNSCRIRSTYNSREMPRISSPDRPEPRGNVEQSSFAPRETSPLPNTVDQVEFSFEIVPSGTVWFQTFLRDEAQNLNRQTDCLTNSLVPDRQAPFLLPYEMSLEAILKSNQTVRKKKRTPKSNNPPNFRPIISTRLQMQSAAKQSQKAAAELLKTSSQLRKRNSAARFNMPRKSPRCHASTMAILCSKSVNSVLNYLLRF